MSYVTVDEVATLVSELGKGALLAKVDIQSAYRLIPVHPQDRPLLTMRWEGQLYIDPMLWATLSEHSSCIITCGCCWADNMLENADLRGVPQS